jgi:hypothetical protein
VVPSGKKKIWQKLGAAVARYHATWFNKKEAMMPALLIPVLVGVPVLLVGGYYIVQAMH